MSDHTTNYSFGGKEGASVTHDAKGQVRGMLKANAVVDEPPPLSDQKPPEEPSQECAGCKANEAMQGLNDALNDMDKKLADLNKQLKGNIKEGLINADGNVGAVFQGMSGVQAAAGRLGKTLLTRAVDSVYQGGSQQALKDLRTNVGPIAQGAAKFADSIANGTNNLQNASAASDRIAAPFELVGSKLAYMTPGAARGMQAGKIAYVDKIAQVAKVRDEVILIQHVNPKAAALLKNGAATKPMHIKAKTDADGLIPMNQAHSPKGAAKGGDWVNEQNKSLKARVESGEYTTMKGPNGNDVLAKQLPDGRVVPVTADHDLLAVGSKTPTGAPIDTPTRGTITPGQMDTMDDINRAANHPGGRIVHHGPENLYAGEGAKFPVTAVTPNGTTIINNQAQLKQFFNQQNAQGYNLHPHESWGWTKGPDGNYR